MNRIKRSIRACCAAALLAVAVTHPGEAKADVLPTPFMLCQAYCTIATAGCVAKFGTSDVCSGFFSGCMTGCGF